VYFYDNGIRNALIGNFAPLELRNDVGVLWENLMISERMKHNAYSQSYAQMYFWRTQQQQEVDLIEEKDGLLTAFEFKWHKPNAKLPKAFSTTYPNTPFQVVTPDNYSDFV
jgi:predicted AAA+ superfamily ATPase